MCSYQEKIIKVGGSFSKVDVDDYASSAVTSSVTKGDYPFDEFGNAGHKQLLWIASLQTR